jgi:hypothetical protein
VRFTSATLVARCASMGLGALEFAVPRSNLPASVNTVLGDSWFQAGGIVSSSTLQFRNTKYPLLFAHSCSTDEGTSGAPVLQDGRVVGTHLGAHKRNVAISMVDLDLSAEAGGVGALDTPVPQGRRHFDPEAPRHLGHEKPPADDASADDPPATEGSLPSHSPGGNRAGRLRAARRMEADGRAADEAAARRTMTGLPFSECGSGRLRKAPTRNQRPSGSRNRTGRTPDLRVQDQPGRRRDFGSRAATGEEGASAPDMSGRTGFRPGSCEAARTQGASPWTCQAEEKLRLRIPPDAEPEASAEGTARVGRGTSVPNSPSGEPPGLRP